ncbi:DUF4214 domain-containing protein [Iamia sp.]|uniref:DUF4214 domain-containing protein n=1 Tax=Iamia sp. TaxID=2722710 RepID=UPI002B54E5BF|nr:DUF4214 domain-containing protein [Iamia sp.]HXH59500.1 DUF4214 domain-containing protein [Iamia sp.]
MAWAGRVRSGDSLEVIAGDVTTRAGFAARYGSLGGAAFVDAAHRNATGAAPTATWASTWTDRLAAGTATRAEVMAAIAALPAAVTRLRPEVEVMMTYAGLLRRAPDASGYAFWLDKVRAGTSIQRLIAQFFASAEYRRRFA